MKTIIKKDGRTAQVSDGLSLTLSRPVKQDMVIEFITVAQSRKKEIDKRSALQNKAIHMVCNDLQKNTGIKSALDFYFDFKREYLAQQIKQDDAEYALLIEKFEALSLVMDSKAWRSMADKVYTSRDANIKQFHHAFEDFCQYHASKGHQFRHPEDYQAMLQDKFYLGLINPVLRAVS